MTGKRLAGFLAGLLSFAVPGVGWAQAYPTRPVTMVVPGPAGGTTDVIARIAAQAMSADLGQPVVIENMAGAGMTLGTQRVVRAEPDGYTLSFGNMGSLAAAGALYPKLGDPRRDLVPIGLVATVPMVLSVSKASGIADLAALRERLKSGDVKFGHPGLGTVNHLAVMAFLAAADAKAIQVGYRGGGPANNDLMAGVIDAVIDQTVSTIPMLQSGLTKGLGVTSPSRLSQLPDVPTFAEAGLPGFDLTVWNAIAAPKGSPPAVVARLEAALAKALADPNLLKRFSDLAAVAPSPSQMGSVPLGRLMASDGDRLEKIIESAGIRLE